MILFKYKDFENVNTSKNILYKQGHLIHSGSRKIITRKLYKKQLKYKIKKLLLTNINIILIFLNKNLEVGILEEEVPNGGWDTLGRNSIGSHPEKLQDNFKELIILIRVLKYKKGR